MKSSEKNVKIIFFVLLISMFAMGCQQAIEPNDPPENHVDDINVLVESIKNMGLDTTDYFVTDNGIVVEGDIFFDMDELRKGIVSDKDAKQEDGSEITVLDKQYGHAYTLNPGFVGNITVSWTNQIYPRYGDPVVSQEWINAVYQAVNDWNNLGGGVHFTITYDPYADIKLVATYIADPSSFVIASKLPGVNDYRPCGNMYINAWADNLNLSASQRENTMVHELGHFVGLRHTGVNDEGARYLVPNTPASDSLSFMIRDVYKNWTGFSAYDIQAIWYLFDNSSPYIMLYDGVNFSGKRWIVRGNNHSLWFDGFNDQTMSLRLFNGARVILFEHVEWEGTFFYTRTDVNDLGPYNFNKKTSSVWFY